MRNTPSVTGKHKLLKKDLRDLCVDNLDETVRLQSEKINSGYER